MECILQGVTFTCKYYPYMLSTSGFFPMNRFKTLAMLGGISIILVLLTFMLYRSVINLSGEYLTDNGNMPVDIHSRSKHPVKYFGVVSRYPAHIIYQQYQPLMDFLNRNTEYHFQLKLSSSYGETAQQLASGEVDVALMGSFVFATTKKDHDLKAILKPLNEDSMALRRSVIFTANNSRVQELEDLRGRKLALASVESFSGNWMPLYMLHSSGLSRDDLGVVSNYPNHHTVIHKVLRGEYDAGAVRESVAREFEHRGIRIVAYSDPLPTSPIVVMEGRDPDLEAAIITALVHENPWRSGLTKPIDVLDGGTIISYVMTDGSEYDFIYKIINQ
jgi:phosphonate transport system substrate-binding protein